MLRKVNVIADPTLDAPARYGVHKLVDALRAKGLQVTEDATSKRGDLTILAGISSNGGPAFKALKQAGANQPIGRQALAVRTHTNYQGRPAVALVGADGVGLMYAALDLADRVGWSTESSNPLEFARDVSERPFLKDRGVVMFTMNQAYFESRLLDRKFWVRYLDMMASNRFNRLVLTFGYEDGGYMAPPYPYFFNVDGFPNVHVVGQTPEQQTRNLDALRTVIRLAAERGIRIKPGIWEHIYRGRPRGQDGGIPWAADGLKPTPGLVWGLDAQNLIPYTVAALRKFHKMLPEIDEVQFRMHGESGLFTNEIEGFWHEVFGFYRAERRNVKLELRVKELPKSVIKDAQAQGLNIQLDTKVWMEQMGLPFHPTHINRENQMEARHSYADLLEYPQTYHMNWTLWNGGTARLLLWGDPDYARRMVENARLYDGQGLAATEMEATKMLGDTHDTKPRDFLNARYRYTDYEFERYWDFYRMFGRLAYNPRLSPEVYEKEFDHRFGSAAAPHLMKALELSSRVLPRIVAASIPYQMFPTTNGWPEMMHIGSLPKYAEQEEGSDVQQFLNFREEAARIANGADTPKRRPEETSRWFAKTSESILAEVAAAEKSIGGQPPSNEFKSTIADAKILAALARYHSWRQLGGVNYELYKLAGDLGAFDEAIADERQAIQAWRDIVSAAGDMYIDNIAFGPAARGFPRHWKDELKPLDSEFDQLVAERRTRSEAEIPASVASRDGRGGENSPRKSPILPDLRVRPLRADPNPPIVSFLPGTPLATPGKEFVVNVRAFAPAGVKWIHLRYRHLNQKEDYQSVDMVSTGQPGAYRAAIPASFIDPHWDLMYFVEVVDNKGAGRMYPDLEVETPYKIIGVSR